MSLAELDTTHLPQDYRKADDAEMTHRIMARKNELGNKLVILAHHYQRMEIVALNDFLGDSYALAKQASKQEQAEKIVFCGVRFMAEAADILTDDRKDVYLAHPKAGCPMADMAPDNQVYEAWQHIDSIIGSDKIIPLTYMNSSANLKAFCGKNGGLVCTSSNADAAYDYIFDRGKRLFFFPDRHLGRNTANRKKIARDQVVVYNPKLENGGLSEDEISNAKVILWHGNCPVHVNFNKDQIDRIRHQMPRVKIVVHPECPEEVVNLADSVGSTAHIVNYVKNAPSGSVIAVGTESSMVRRLAVTYDDKKIFCLADNESAVCADMYKTTLNDLCFTLENFDKAELVKVPDEVSHFARLALERMLEIGK